VATEAFSVATAPLLGAVEVPGSKSVSNRALVCAALAHGASRLHGLADGDDTNKMLAGLRQLGAVVEDATAKDHFTAVRGPIDLQSTAAVTVDAGLAGTTSRFLTAVAALRRGPTTVTGEPGLRARPMGELHRILRELGFAVSAEREGHLPVIVQSKDVSSVARHGETARELRVSGEVSSQFVSAVMMIAPLIGGIRLRLVGPVVSRGYLDMTAEVMRTFGTDVEVREDEVIVAKGSYVATEYAVDADWSSASYPFAAAAIIGGQVTVPRLRRNGAQPEEDFTEVLIAMGCSVRITDSAVTVSRLPDSALRGIDVDMSSMSDLVPTLATIAAFAESGSSAPKKATASAISLRNYEPSAPKCTSSLTVCTSCREHCMPRCLTPTTIIAWRCRSRCSVCVATAWLCETPRWSPNHGPTTGRRWQVVWASRLETSHIDKSASRPELRGGIAGSLEGAHHSPALADIRRKGGDHLVVGATRQAGERPSNGVLHVKVAYGQRVGIAMRHSDCNCSGPHADSGQLHERTASIRPGKLGGALNEMRMTRNGDERTGPLLLDAKAMKLP